MPYKREGRRVLKQVSGRWTLEKEHPTEEAAQRHLTALNINVTLPEKHPGIAARLREQRKK